MTIFNHVIGEEDGNEFKAYIATPPGGKGPGLILLHEVYGVNDSLKAVADDYAQKGFVVMCPNMYWRDNQDANPQLSASRRGDDPRSRPPAQGIMQTDGRHGLRPRRPRYAIGDRRSARQPRLHRQGRRDGRVSRRTLCLHRGGWKPISMPGWGLYATRFKDEVARSAAKREKSVHFHCAGKDPYVTEEEKPCWSKRPDKRSSMCRAFSSSKLTCRIRAAIPR